MAVYTACRAHLVPLGGSLLQQQHVAGVGHPACQPLPKCWGSMASIEPQRFGQNFVGRVAYPVCPPAVTYQLDLRQQRLISGMLSSWYRCRWMFAEQGSCCRGRGLSQMCTASIASCKSQKCLLGLPQHQNGDWDKTAMCSLRPPDCSFCISKKGTSIWSMQAHHRPTFLLSPRMHLCVSHLGHQVLM